MTSALEQAAYAAQRPVITLAAGELNLTVDAIEDALINAGSPIYARGETLVRAVPAAPEPGAVRRAEGGMILTGVTAVGLQDELEGIAEFVRIVEGKEGATTKRVGAPALACSALLQRIGRWNFPALRGIASCPFMRSDGTIASRPGYDKDSGLLLAIPHQWPAPKPKPSRHDAVQALAKLRQLISTFCFVTPADEAVMLSAMLTPLVRPGIEAAPMHGFSAPTRGSGKSLLTDLVSIIGTGRPAAVVTWGRDDVENEKRLTGTLLAGDSVLTLDNIEVPLRGELLCSALTQSSAKLRPLGSSTLVNVPSVATMLCTGNALTLAGDMTRRVLVSELDPQHERPELREFANDAKADALAARVDLVNAGLTILRAAMTAEFKRPAPLGSYREWSRRVRDALIWLGMPDPCSVMERTYQGDPELELALAILSAWQAEFPRGSTAADAIRASANGGRLHDALEGLAGPAGRVSSKSLGKWLNRHRGRIMGGMKFMASGDAKRGFVWQVVPHQRGVSGVSGVFSSHHDPIPPAPLPDTGATGPKETPQTPETPPPDDDAGDWVDVP